MQRPKSVGSAQTYAFVIVQERSVAKESTKGLVRYWILVGQEGPPLSSRSSLPRLDILVTPPLRGGSLDSVAPSARAGIRNVICPGLK